MYTQFIAALIKEESAAEAAKCPSVDEWLNTWSVCAMEYYTATKGMKY